MSEGHGAFDLKEIIKPCLIRYVRESASNPAVNADHMCYPTRTTRERNIPLVILHVRRHVGRLPQSKLKESRGMNQ